MANLLNDLAEVSKYLTEEARDQRLADIVEEAMEELATGVSDKEKWIPISERMPDEDEDVHVYRGKGHGIITAYRSEGRWYSHQHDILRDVTHWMPLPEPPKEDQP